MDTENSLPESIDKSEKIPEISPHTESKKQENSHTPRNDRSIWNGSSAAEEADTTIDREVLQLP